jgi:hypothetical protein
LRRFEAGHMPEFRSLGSICLSIIIETCITKISRALAAPLTGWALCGNLQWLPRPKHPEPTRHRFRNVGTFKGCCQMSSAEWRVSIFQMRKKVYRQTGVTSSPCLSHVGRRICKNRAIMIDRDRINIPFSAEFGKIEIVQPCRGMF